MFIMKRNLLLFFVLLVFFMPTRLFADTIYAVQSNDTLTFYYSSGVYVFPQGDDKHTYYRVKAKYGDFQRVNGQMVISVPEWADAGIAHVVFSPSFADARPTSTAYWFFGCEELESVDSVMNLNTEAVTDMARMFYSCSSLTSLDLSGLNTGNVTDMNSMFCGCSSLKSLNISDFNTSRVRGMAEMFQGDSELSSIDVSCFDTSLVQSMWGMFQGCNNLNGLDLSGFDTKNVRNMSFMFSECNSIDSLYLGSFDLTGLTSASGMFSNCGRLKTIVVSDKWNIEYNNDTYFSYSDMFSDCSSLVGGLGTAYQEHNVTDGSYAHIDGGPSDPGYLTVDVMGKFDDDTGATRAYCVLDGGVLTFYYDNKLKSRQGKKYPVEKTYGNGGTPQWNVHRREVTKAVFDKSFAAFRPTSTARWFYNFPYMTAVEGTCNLNTSHVTSMYEMFRFSNSLQSLDLSTWDTSNVTDMGCLFCLCVSLTDINISNFNTSKVTSMLHMFHACPLTTLDLRSFDTSNVTDMVWMFIDSSVETIYASDKWNTDKVQASGQMFLHCNRLVGGRGTKYSSEHIDKEYACIDGGMCAPGYLTGESLEPEAEPYAVFDDEGTLTFYYDGNKNCRDGKVFEMPSMSPDWSFENITHVDFDSSFADFRPTSTYCWFEDLHNLESISNIQFLNTEQVVDMRNMFDCCEKLKHIDVSHFDTSKVTDMSGMFWNCTSLTDLDVSNFNTSKVANMIQMFYNCHSLTELDLSNFNTSNVTGMFGMFSFCYSLKELNLSNFNTSKVASLREMFYYCSSLSELDVSSFKTDNVSDFLWMFNNCAALTTIYASSYWNTDGLDRPTAMFAGCDNLVGGQGTRYADHPDDYDSSLFAHIDGGPSNPGYFTYKEYVIPTDIDMPIVSNSNRQSENNWYSLQGVRVSSPSKGVYIRKGKQYLVKW